MIINSIRLPHFVIISVLIIPIPLHLTLAQNALNTKIDSLVLLIANNNEDLINYTDDETISISDRLGIRYNGIVNNKFLISYEFDENISEEIKSGKLEYYYELDSIDAIHKKLTITVDSINYSRTYYLKNDLIQSPVLFLTRGWNTIDSEHFRFIINDPRDLNQFSIDELENHFLVMANLLDYSENDLEIIKQNKILYVLCRDEKDDEILTGHSPKGICNLAYDAIITSYNVHYHELMHLMINYKLKKLNLYTHPFLLEGFAVAFGGRGGLHPRVLLQMGSFLINSGFIDVEELLDYTNFVKMDASISYPVSGIYTFLLINEFGIDSFLTLYQKYSGIFEEVKLMTIHTNELLSRGKFKILLDEHNFEFIKSEMRNDKSEVIHTEPGIMVYSDTENYYFYIEKPLLLKTDYDVNGYVSKKIIELNLEIDYSGEQYLINANGNEISVYDLYTNTLILSYVQSFQDDLSPVLKIENSFVFSIPNQFLINPVFNIN
ncbi:MAG: hypothetical protein R6W68_02305 [Ignavibacteriaceae bacterium]